MVLQNEIMNAASKQYNMNYVTKTDVVQKYSEENITENITDVAASVSISKKVDKDVSAYTGIIDKAQESVTKNQVADMSLAEMNKKLYKITQLSIQANYEGKSYNDKKEIQEEINKLRLEIQNVGKGTNFNGENVFATTGDDAEAPMPKIGIDYTNVLDEIDTIDVTTPEGSKDALKQINKAMDYIDNARSYIQSEQNRLIQVIQSAVGAM